MFVRFVSRHAAVLYVLMLFSMTLAACRLRIVPTPTPVFRVLTPTYIHLTPTAVPTPLPLDLTTIEAVDWDIYDSDSDHLWNRVLRQFYSRTTPQGNEYGQDVLDPLLWWDTVYLLEGEPYQQAIALLDEFLTTDGAELITDPLKRAVFQRDLWAVFDWAAFGDDHPVQRAALSERLARMMQQVALTDAQISALPDNYAQAVASDYFYTSFPEDRPVSPYLPAALTDADNWWVLLGRESGPIALTHTASFPVYGRSVFLVYLRESQGSAQAFAFAQALRRGDQRAPVGLTVALVRKALLINTDGHIVPSPLTESIQVRFFATGQLFFEHVLRRELLFAGIAGGLVPAEGDLPVFMSHGDPFQFGPEFLEHAEMPESCRACHESSEITGPQSIISITRARFALGEGETLTLTETTFEDEAQKVIAWKQTHATWQTLLALWGENR